MAEVHSAELAFTLNWALVRLISATTTWMGVAVPLVGFSSRWNRMIHRFPKLPVRRGGGRLGMGAMNRAVGTLSYFGCGVVIFCLGVDAAWAKDLGGDSLGLDPPEGTVVHGFSVGRASAVEAGSSVSRCLPLSTHVGGVLSEERTDRVLLSRPGAYAVCLKDSICWSMQSRMIHEIFFVHLLVRGVGSLGGAGNEPLDPFGKWWCSTLQM